MEEFGQTVNRVLKRLLGKKAHKFEIVNSINEFFEMKGINLEEFEVDVKRKYVYIRVKNPYMRQEMSLMLYELMEFLKKKCSKIMSYEIKFTGRP